jgi:tRNA (guanine-N7-)-methyltransferase
MSLPSNLPSYEFQRILEPSKDVDKFYHLRIVKTQNGLPMTVPFGTSTHNPVNPEFFFNQPNHMEIEIGCGKGGFMVEYCSRHPHTSFLAVEKEPSVAFLAARRIAKRMHLVNSRVVCGDVFYLFRDFLPDNSISKFHMYFPDPWPKKKHKKRRLMKPDFLKQVYRIAIPNALFYWTTDHQNYHEESWKLITSMPWIEIVKAGTEPTEDIITNYERKYLAQNKELYRTIIKILKA